MIDLGEVQPSEIVGHDISSSDLEKAKKFGTIRRSIRKNLKQSLERDPLNGRNISVNRVSETVRLGKLQNLVDIILTRPTPEHDDFWGWGLLTVSEIIPEGYVVKKDPRPACGNMPCNPYHALVKIPIDKRDNEFHIEKLARWAVDKWKSC